MHLIKHAVPRRTESQKLGTQLKLLLEHQWVMLLFVHKVATNQVFLFDFVMSLIEVKVAFQLPRKKFIM